MDISSDALMQLSGRATMLPNDFAVIIPTHCYDRVYTESSVFKVWIHWADLFVLSDDGDKQLDQYKEKYGDNVLVFSKDDYAGKFDKMDNFGNNALLYMLAMPCGMLFSCWLKILSVADDDYSAIEYRITSDGGYYAKKVKNADVFFLRPYKLHARKRS